jgi:hypothetical protein
MSKGERQYGKVSIHTENKTIKQMPMITIAHGTLFIRVISHTPMNPSGNRMGDA